MEAPALIPDEFRKFKQELIPENIEKAAVILSGYLDEDYDVLSEPRNMSIELEVVGEFGLDEFDELTKKTENCAPLIMQSVECTFNPDTSTITITSSRLN